MIKKRAKRDGKYTRRTGGRPLKNPLYNPLITKGASKLSERFTANPPLAGMVFDEGLFNAWIAQEAVREKTVIERIVNAKGKRPARRSAWSKEEIEGMGYGLRTAIMSDRDIARLRD